MTRKLLIVDDDATLVRFLDEYLREDGFAVVKANSGKDALRKFYEHRPDLAILDVMMPGMDGWEVCARLRELSRVPIIMLTAKTSEADKLRGFRLGIDDYITKPFSLAELAARVRAVLARSEDQRSKDSEVIQIGPLRVEVGRHEVYKNGEQLEMTETEFRLLAALVRKAGHAISKHDLVVEVWGPEHLSASSALRRYIWFLRQKIEEDPNDPKRLVTVRGYGYRLELE